MKIPQIVETYITHKQALGMRFVNEGYALRSFGRAMGNIALPEADPTAVLAFIGDASRPGRWRCYYRIFRSFYRYALERGLVDRSPLPERAPRFPPPLQPYIYTTDQLSRLLDSASRLGTTYSPLQPTTYRTLILLIYGAALRVSEAIHLTVADVDCDEQMLIVRKTKFYKERLVPVGPKLSSALLAYRKSRLKLPLPASADSCFFCNRTGGGLDRDRVEKIFRRLCEQADIRRSGGPRTQPRIHDLRHTSVTDRLISWYEAGEDVERLLPHLATYLGHNGIHSTQRYLSLTPRLMQQASARFHRYFNGGAL